MLAAADAVAPDRTLTLSVGVRVRIAGPGLVERLAPALIEGDGPPRGNIVAWEGELPSPPWDASEPGQRFTTSEGVQVLYSADTLTLLDGDRGVFWTRDAEALPRWETAAPLRTLLRWLLRERGLHAVHGAVVVGPRGAALLAGPSGAGKSTTAIAAAEVGLGYVGDDYCAVELGAPPRAHALCSVGKLDAPWPGLRILAGDLTPDGKTIVVPNGMIRSAPLVSIVLPRIAGDAPGLAPARPAEALSALATSVLLLPGSRQADLDALSALARSLPAHRLTTGPDPHAAAALLAEHLA